MVSVIVGSMGLKDRMAYLCGLRLSDRNLPFPDNQFNLD